MDYVIQRLHELESLSACKHEKSVDDDVSEAILELKGWINKLR
jgi:hypothetical protein